MNLLAKSSELYSHQRSIEYTGYESHSPNSSSTSSPIALPQSHVFNDKSMAQICDLNLCQKTQRKPTKNTKTKRKKKNKQRKSLKHKTTITRSRIKVNVDRYLMYSDKNVRVFITITGTLDRPKIDLLCQSIKQKTLRHVSLLWHKSTDTKQSKKYTIAKKIGFFKHNDKRRIVTLCNDEKLIDLEFKIQYKINKKNKQWSAVSTKHIESYPLVIELV